jgi:hypothetical protein
VVKSAAIEAPDMSREPARSVAVQNEKSAIHLRLCNFDPPSRVRSVLALPHLVDVWKHHRACGDIDQGPHCARRATPPVREYEPSGKIWSAFCRLSQVGPIHTLVVGIEHRSDMLTAVTLDANAAGALTRANETSPSTTPNMSDLRAPQRGIPRAGPLVSLERLIGLSSFVRSGALRP